MATRYDPEPPVSPFEARQAAAAARDAAAIGGRVRYEDPDPAQRALIESGEGVAEGFELAEQDLIDAAQHTERLQRRFAAAWPTETEGTGPVGEYGEADVEPSAEVRDSDR